MLDQNTDRMWYVIGAVIVGAAIIFLVNSSFPQLFASVGDTFKGSVTEVSKTITTLSPVPDGENEITYKDFRVHEAIQTDYDVSTDTWALTLPPIDPARPSTIAFWNRGLQLKPKSFWVPFGKSMRMSYEVYVSPSETDKIVKTDINNALEENLGERVTNDNDDLSKRVLDGVVGRSHDTKLKAGEWNKLTVEYFNTSLTNNPFEERMYDYTSIGAMNDSTRSLDIKIRNIKMSVQ